MPDYQISEEQLIRLLNTHQSSQPGHWEDLLRTEGQRWEIGRGRHSGLLAIANEKYHIELNQDNQIQVLDKQNRFQRVTPTPALNTILPPSLRELIFKKNPMLEETIGTFSHYKGIDGQNIGGNDAQGFLAKSLLSELKPAEGWERSHVTYLQKPLAEQRGKVTIKAKGLAQSRFGGGKITVSKSTLAQLSDSARIVTNSELMPSNMFIKIQNELRESISDQEQRSLKTLLGSNYATWRSDWRNLGYASQEAFDKAANLPLNALALGICHSQETHFFVEQEVVNEQARNKLRTAHLDTATPSVVISACGLNLAYGGLDIDKMLHDGSAKFLIKSMLNNVLSATVAQNCRNLSVGAIGLGAFLPDSIKRDPVKSKEIASLYYDSLMELVSDPLYKGKFDNIYVNPVFPFAWEAFEAAKQNHAIPADTNVIGFGRDNKFLCVEMSKQGIRCAMLNPSDPDVMWGKYDVGEYYKSGHYVGEEDIAATSTAALGSAGISDVYVNRAKISSVIVPQSAPRAEQRAGASSSSSSAGPHHAEARPEPIRPSGASRAAPKRMRPPSDEAPAPPTSTSTWKAGKKPGRQ